MILCKSKSLKTENIVSRNDLILFYRKKVELINTLKKYKKSSV